MRPLPSLVSDELRNGLLQALQCDDYFIFDDGRRCLRLHGFDPPEFVVTHLIDYLLQGSPVYALPDNRAKCQCCLYYENNLVIHVKLTPQKRTEGYFVKLGFHHHDTGYPPLPD